MFLRKNSTIALVALAGSAAAIKMKADVDKLPESSPVLQNQLSDFADPETLAEWAPAAADAEVLQELKNMSYNASDIDIAPGHWHANCTSMESGAGSMLSSPKRRRASFASFSKGAMQLDWKARAMEIKQRMMSTKEVAIETPKELLARARDLANEINECVDLDEAQELKVELEKIHTAFESAQKKSGRNRSLGSNAVGKLVAKAAESIAEKQAIADQAAAQREADLDEANGLLHQAKLSVQACFDVKKASTQVAMQAMELQAIVEKYEDDVEFLAIKNEMTSVMATAVKQKQSSGNRKRRSKKA